MCRRTEIYYKKRLQNVAGGGRASCATTAAVGPRASHTGALRLGGARASRVTAATVPTLKGPRGRDGGQDEGAPQGNREGNIIAL